MRGLELRLDFPPGRAEDEPVTPSDVEERFVRSFIRRDRRNRILEQLASPRKRRKLHHRLAHTFIWDLDSRYAYRSEDASILSRAWDAMEAYGKDPVVHVICQDSKLDGQALPLSEVTSLQPSFGAVIIFGPEHLAHYLSEDPAQPTLPLVVAGDLNDIEGSRVIGWLEREGMTNALPEFDAYTPTWEWQTSLVTLRRRMDHILYSPELRSLSARVVPGGASDHVPVEAVLARK